MITNSECLLNAVTANTTGDWFPVTGSRGVYSLQTILTGSPAGGTVTLEGSNDGKTATTLATFTIGTDTSGDFKYAVDKPVGFVRGKLASLSGGTNPTVSAYVSVG